MCQEHNEVLVNKQLEKETFEREVEKLDERRKDKSSGDGSCD